MQEQEMDLTERLAKSAGKAPEDAALAESMRVLDAAIAKVTESPATAQDQVQALLEDMCGQSKEALSRWDYFDKWGRHYLPSVMFAHKMQQCNNFKDPGVQKYGGKLFNEIRDAADDAFNELQIEEATRAEYRYLGGGKLIVTPRPPSSAARAAPAPVSMAAYNDVGAG